MVAVDATAHESLAQKYQIQGFPTIKIFGADKRNPVDYQGARTADGLISQAMKSANQLVKDRKAGKSSSSKSSSKSEKSEPAGEKKPKKKTEKKRSAVQELDEVSFNALVLDSNDHWLVEFYAPWCGHCKALQPSWKAAAERLASDGVKLGAVDATAHPNLAQKYGVKGYPTIKLFPAGPKTSPPQDYSGARETDAIVSFALESLERSGAPVPINQITNPEDFSSSCEGNGAKLCAILFLPHILDTGAKGRNDYLDLFQDLAKTFRKMPIAFLWSEATAQPQLENALSINGNFPTVAVVSLEKNVYAVPKISWSKKNLQTFLNGVLTGGEKTAALSSKPSIVSVPAWDGKDVQMEVEEMPLDELFDKDEL